MVSSPRQCPGNAEKVCYCFLLARDNDPHQFCTFCQGKTCNINDRCEECHDWTDDMWYRVGVEEGDECESRFLLFFFYL